MQKAQRLTDQENFSNIRKYGRGVANRLLVLRIHPNELDTSRFAFLTGKRIGNAVIRNRMKRRLREAVRSSSVKGGWNAIFIVRRGSQAADFHQLRDAVADLLARAGLIEGGESGPKTGGPSRRAHQPTPEHQALNRTGGHTDQPSTAKFGASKL